MSSSYDAFLSYATSDRKAARRIQRFCESWRDKQTGRRLHVFLDYTDIRGGRLDEELRRAVRGARKLVVCYSPAAAESRWVETEIGLFLAAGAPDCIAVAVVDGDLAATVAARQIVPRAEVRVHDLRRGRWLGVFGLGVKLEMLRLLGFIADLDMRTLRNWHIRRSVANVTAFVLLALLPLWALLSWPLDNWEMLPLHEGQRRIYAVAAEANGEKLMVAARFRGAGPQGFRDYVQSFDDALSTQPRGSFEGVVLRRRLLPAELLPYAASARIPLIDLAAYTTRPAASSAPTLVCELASGRFVIVHPLQPSDEELDEARDNAADFGTPIPNVHGSLVVTIDGDRRVASEVEDLSPQWRREDRRFPARGLSVVQSPEGDIWLGMAGRDAGEVGGLWVRRAGQTRWERQLDFRSVHSVDLEVENGRTVAVVVSERHVDLWAGIQLVPWPTRVVRQVVGTRTWEPASAPPHGSRSEVDFVGRAGGARLVRVDENIYSERKVPLWKFLTRR
jgi:hypothetical protein